MALLDEIKARLAKAQPATPAGSAQAAAQAVFQAKTGRAAPAGAAAAPAASNLGEQLANAQAAAKAAQTQAQGAVAAEGLAQGEEALAAQATQAAAEAATQRREAAANVSAFVGEAAAGRAARSADVGAKLSARETAASRDLAGRYSETMATLAAQRKLTVDDLFAEHQASTKDLAARRDASQLEQKAHLLAMSSQAYVDDLKRVGQTRRLQNAGDFALESQRLALGDKLAQVLKGLRFSLDLNANQATFEKQLEKIDLAAALEVAKSTASRQSTATMIQNVSTALPGFVGAMNKSTTNTGNVDTFETTAPKGGNSGYE